MAADLTTCSNSECNFANDGKCVEGYALEECPHYGKLSIDQLEDSEPAEDPVEAATPTITLNAGSALDRASASALQRARISKTVAIIGPHDSGKTSLIAGVYDLFQEGDIGPHSFAGSATMPDFEKICHDSRAASRRSIPHTQRTIVGAEVTFFHLDISENEHPGITSLFIGDRSGEDYLMATDEIAQAASFFELRRADTITLLVNGAHLTDSEHRHETKAMTPQLIAALVEAGSIGKRQKLALVLTKKDTVLASPHSVRAQAEFSDMVEAIREQYSHKVSSIVSFTVAASPKVDSGVKRGDGLDELLSSWLASSGPEYLSYPAAALPARYIDRLSDLKIEAEND